MENKYGCPTTVGVSASEDFVPGAHHPDDEEGDDDDDDGVGNDSAESSLATLSELSLPVPRMNSNSLQASIQMFAPSHPSFGLKSRGPGSDLFTLLVFHPKVGLKNCGVRPFLFSIGGSSKIWSEEMWGRPLIYPCPKACYFLLQVSTQSTVPKLPDGTNYHPDQKLMDIALQLKKAREHQVQTLSKPLVFVCSSMCKILSLNFFVCCMLSS